MLHKKTNTTILLYIPLCMLWVSGMWRNISVDLGFDRDHSLESCCQYALEVMAQSYSSLAEKIQFVHMCEQHVLKSSQESLIRRWLLQPSFEATCKVL